MKYFFALLLAAICLTAVGQISPTGVATQADFSKGEDAAWTNFCNHALDLTGAEQAEFWIVYHQMEADSLEVDQIFADHFDRRRTRHRKRISAL